MKNIIRFAGSTINFSYELKKCPPNKKLKYCLSLIDSALYCYQQEWILKKNEGCFYFLDINYNRIFKVIKHGTSALEIITGIFYYGNHMYTYRDGLWNKIPIKSCMDSTSNAESDKSESSVDINVESQRTSECFTFNISEHSTSNVSETTPSSICKNT